MAWLNQPSRIRLKHRTVTRCARMRHILIAIIAVIALQGCSEEPVEPAVGELDFVGSNGEIIRTIEVEFAEDDESRATGLMHRRQLSLSQGMLFIFPAPDSLSFWMANTPIPLDIIFLGADSTVVNIAKRTTPLSREFIRSTDLAQYVVEVRGGFSDRFGIDNSTRIQWRKTENTE